MKSPHIIFIDFDGTLVTKERRVPRENLDAIQKVRSLGHKVFVNTGRSYANCPPGLLEFVDAFDGLVCGNGSYITCNGEVLQNIYLSDELFTSIAKFFLSHPESSCIFQSDRLLLGTGDNINVFAPGCEILHSADEIAEKYMNARFNVFCVEGQMNPEFFTLFGDFIRVFQCRTYADCVTKGLSKEIGAKAVAEHFSIPMENTVAIGDSENDVPMFNCCGTAVAVGNAPDPIKAFADIVTAPNHEFGVAKILYELFA